MFIKNGFNDFLPKPIDTVLLNSVLENWIPKEKQIRAAGKNRTNSEQNDREKINIDGLDTRKGIFRAGGTFENYLAILETFYNDGMEKINEIRKCLEKNDSALYTIYLHALKSACSNVGADRLSEAAGALERAGEQGNVNYINMHNAEFLANLNTLLESINKTVKDFRIKTKSDSINTEQIKAELLLLDAALGEMDSIKIKKTSKILREYMHSAEDGEIIENILNYVLTGEYEEAHLLIVSALNKLSEN